MLVHLPGESNIVFDAFEGTDLLTRWELPSHISFVSTPIIVYWTTVDKLYGSPVGASMICGIYSVNQFLKAGRSPFVLITMPPQTAVSVSCLVLPLISGVVLGKVGISLGWKILLGIITGCLIACLGFVYRSMRLPDATSQSAPLAEDKAESIA